MKKYDGCSGGMSKTWRKVLGKNPPWEGCCDVHDQPYARGGSWLDRLIADIELLACMWKGGHPFWALVMFIGVRIGGVPFLPTPWRWGFNTKRYWYTDDLTPLVILVILMWGWLYGPI